VGKYSRLIISGLVLGFFIGYFLLNRSRFSLLLNLNIWPLFFIALADIATIFMNGLFTKFILEPFNKSIPILESFFVSLISSVGNFFAPAGAGFGIRAVYLKKEHGLAYSDFISTLAGNYIIVFLVNSFFGLLSLYFLRDLYNTQYLVLLIVFSVIFLGSLVLSLVRLSLSKTEQVPNKYLKSIAKTLYKITSGWNHIISHRKLLIQLVLITLTNLSLTVFITWTIIQSLHLSIGFASLLLFSVLGSLSLFINITPANLGIKEAIYLFSAAVLGFSVSQVLSIALIDRGVQFMVLLILWLLFSKYRGVSIKYYPQK
jgi:uncharacterized protein (TIRG00374 family)